MREQATIYAHDLSRAIPIEKGQTNELAILLTELRREYEATLRALMLALDARDAETEGHSRRVMEYTLLLASAMGLKGEILEAVKLGALFHDIGKIGVPDAILHKPGPLTAEEWEIMHRHPILGYEILSEIGFLKEAAIIVLHHHEWYNGKGYPQGLKGEEIHVGARIFAVVDALDAITTDRPYRRRRSFEVALDEIARHSGTQFDPEVVEALLDTVAQIERKLSKGNSA